MTAEGKALMMMIDFHKLVVRDGIDPQAAHQQFLKIRQISAVGGRQLNLNAKQTRGSDLQNDGLIALLLLLLLFIVQPVLLCIAASS